MERRGFLQALSGLLAVPFLGRQKKEPEVPKPGFYKGNEHLPDMTLEEAAEHNTRTLTENPKYHAVDWEVRGVPILGLHSQNPALDNALSLIQVQNVSIDYETEITEVYEGGLLRELYPPNRPVIKASIQGLMLDEKTTLATSLSYHTEEVELHVITAAGYRVYRGYLSTVGVNVADGAVHLDLTMHIQTEERK